MCCCLRKACSALGGTPKILISISATNPTYILHTMPEDIQEHMLALITQHDNALTALVALWQQPEAYEKNDEQTDSLKNPVPHNINVVCSCNFVICTVKYTHTCALGTGFKLGFLKWTYGLNNNILFFGGPV